MWVVWVVGSERAVRAVGAGGRAEAAILGQYSFLFFGGEEGMCSG